MPATYAQLIESVLTDVAKDGWERFRLSWFRKRIHAQARRVKRKLGPRLNTFIYRTLEHQAQLGYLHLDDGRHGLSIYMSAGGRHEYLHRTSPVAIRAPLSGGGKTRRELLQENKRLKAELVKIEARLVRANSAFDTEDSSDVEEVMGSPAAVTERIKRLTALSKNRKHQISLLHAVERYQHNWT